MADRKITDLTALAAGSQATGDLLTIVDVSEAAATDKNKKITVESLFKGIPSNVGIGTSSPSRSLDVSGNGVHVSNTGTTGAAFNIVPAANGQDGAELILSFHSGTGYGPLKFNVGNGERMRIDSSGNVGIGTSSPGATLHLNKSGTSDFTTLYLSNSGASGRSYQIGVGGNSTGTGYANNLYIYDNSAAAKRVVLDSSGNVGIGMSSPVSPIHIKGDNTTAGYLAPGLTIEQDGTGDAVLNFLLTGTQRFQMGIDNSDSDKLKIFADASGDFSGTGITLDTSGKVGINTTSPNDVVSIKSTGSSSTGRGITINAAASGDTAGVMRILSSSGTQHAEVAAYTNNLIISADESSAAIKLKTAGSERMSIASGIISTAARVSINNSGTHNFTGLAVDGTSTSYHVAYFKDTRSDSASGAGMIQFRRTNGAVGSISTTTSSTSYNTTSDYRLKENVVDLDGAIARVKQLSPKRFNFIVDAETTVDGFLAHEAQTVVPEAVTGTHNEVDDDGNAVMQGIDQSKLVPLLTAALQEAIAEIETLKTKVAALEAG